MRRLELKMSQDALAKYLGITFQQVQKYEKGVNGIRGSRMEKLAEALQIPVGWFYERPQVLVHSDVEKFMILPDGVHLAQVFLRLTPDMRRSLLNIAEALATA
jgi:transcriptional regulator with XRE-family HTH domain